MNPQRLKELEVKVVWRDYDKLSNQATDWLIKSWEQTETKKQLCLDMHKKFHELASKKLREYMKLLEIQ